MEKDKNNQCKILNECFEALSLILEFDINDRTTRQHAIRVGEGCVLIGDKLGLSASTLHRLYYAGLLHDLGKISIDPKLLARKGGLSDEEFEIIKLHTKHGSRIIATLPGMNELALWIRWHHEWWNGSGYPDGLRGDEIPLEVQILTTVDCFDSLQTPRLDRPRRTPEEAYRIIEEERGTHFNPAIMELVLEMIREKTMVPGESTPSNKFVELKNGFINVPLSDANEMFWEGEGLSGLYPVMRLFARVIDAKHSYTRGHSTRVSILSKFLAEKMRLPTNDILKVEIAGLLHDAGKVGVPIEILDKNGRPDDNEWSVIQGHPQKSFEILSMVSSLGEIAAISAAHHEKYDGTGYPRHAKGAELSTLSQIIAVSDTYDALTSTRAYRKALSFETAYRIIREESGTQFNPAITKYLLETPPKHIDALFDLYEVRDI